MNRDVKVGDEVFIQIEGDALNNWMSIVLNVMKNGDILGDIGYGKTIYLKPHEFILKDEKPTHNQIKMISLLNKDSGTQQPVYVVIEQHDKGVSFFDDNGTKRTYGLDKVKEVTFEDALSVIQQLSANVNLLKQQMIELTDVLSADFGTVKENIKHNII